MSYLGGNIIVEVMTDEYWANAMFGNRQCITCDVKCLVVVKGMCT